MHTRLTPQGRRFSAVALPLLLIGLTALSLTKIITDAVAEKSIAIPPAVIEPSRRGAVVYPNNVSTPSLRPRTSALETTSATRSPESRTLDRRSRPTARFSLTILGKELVDWRANEPRSVSDQNDKGKKANSDKAKRSSALRRSMVE
jgi:hypothetical protein